MCASVFLIFLLQLGAASAVPVTPASLQYTIYSDGIVLVDYSVIVDALQPRVNTTLFGKTFSNVLATNEQGISLDFAISGSTITIDTLGSNRTFISYNTPDLTNKTGQLWTFSTDSAINSTIILPRESTIISLNVAPLSIRDTGGLIELTMPSGLSEITYMV